MSKKDKIRQALNLVFSGIEIAADPANPMAYLNFIDNAIATIKAFKKNKPDAFTTALTASLQMVCDHVSKQFDAVHKHIAIARDEQQHLIGGVHEHLGIARREQKQLFDGVHDHLTLTRQDIANMHFEMRQLFAISLRLICDEFNHIAAYMRDARNENRAYHETNIVYLQEILATTKDIRSGVKRLESDHQTMALRGLGKRIRRTDDYCNGRLTASRRRIEELAAELCDWLIAKENSLTFSALPMHTGRRYLEDEKTNLPRTINDVFRNVTPFTTMQNLGLLAQLAVYNFGIKLFGEKNDPKQIKSKAIVEDVFNPIHWSRAAVAYTHLIAAFPEIIPKQPIQQLLKAAEKQNRFHLLFRNQQLFDYLFRHYATVITEINRIMTEDLHQQSRQLKTDCDTRLQTNDTPVFDLTDNIEVTINNWRDAIPVKKDMVGNNLPVEAVIAQYHGHRPLQSPVFVLAERLGCLNFYRQVYFMETVDPGSKNPQDIRKDNDDYVDANLEVRLAVKFTERDAPHFFQTDHFTTSRAYGNPRKRFIDHFVNHWNAKSNPRSISQDTNGLLAVRAKNSVRAKFLQYRLSSIRTSLGRITQHLEHLDYYRNLIIHYAIAAGFNPNFIARLQRNIWSANDTVNHFQSYLNHATCDTPLPHSTLAPRFAATQAVTSRMLTANRSVDFQTSDCVAGVNIIASRLRSLEVSRMQQMLVAKLPSVTKPKDEKNNTNADQGVVKTFNTKALLALCNQLKDKYFDGSDDIARTIREQRSRLLPTTPSVNTKSPSSSKGINFFKSTAATTALATMNVGPAKANLEAKDEKRSTSSTNAGKTRSEEDSDDDIVIVTKEDIVSSLRL